MKLPAFKPKQGVHIETDPKGTAKPIAHGDDTAVIDDLISQLEVCPSGSHAFVLLYEVMAACTSVTAVKQGAYSSSCISALCM